MAQRQLDTLLRSIRRLAGVGAGTELTDRQLLERFAAGRDEPAFEMLVRRHGPLVLGVCLRVLQHVQDAEDAFQATFLVLARKAPAVPWQEDIGNWLYAVAYRTALKARGEAARRRGYESPLGDLPVMQETSALAWQELRPLLDEEVSRLPAKYRTPVVLCYLEDKTYPEAARILGVAEGTVSSRLARAREKLRTRLVRRGLTLSAGLLTTALAQHALSAAVSAELLRATLDGVTGKVSAGAISLQATALAKEVLRTMFLTKLKIAAALLLSVTMVGGGAGMLSYRAAQARAQEAGRLPDDDAVRQENERLKRELTEANQKVRMLEDWLATAKVRSRAPLYQGKPAEHWLAKLRDLDAGYRIDALYALGHLAGVDRSVVPFIEESLKDPAVCGAAAASLADLGSDAIPKLAIMLKDKDVVLRRGAMIGLAQIGPRATAAVAGALKDTDADVRQSAISGLAAFAKQGMNETEVKLSVAALIPALRQEDLHFHGNVLSVLGEFGPAAESAVPALIEATKEDHREVQLRAISALARIGPAAKAAVPALIAARQQERVILDRDFRAAVDKALAKIDPGCPGKKP